MQNFAVNTVDTTNQRFFDVAVYVALDGISVGGRFIRAAHIGTTASMTYAQETATTSRAFAFSSVQLTGMRSSARETLLLTF